MMYSWNRVSDLLQSFILGFAITAVPGAVFFETIRRTLGNNSSVYSFLVGNFTGMLVVIATVFFGISTFLNKQFVENIFYIASGIILLFIGIQSVLSQPSADAIGSPKVAKLRHMHLSATFAGIVLAVANPVSIIFWASLMGTFISSMGKLSAVMNIFAVLLGAVVLFIILVYVAGRMKSYLNDNLLLWLTRVFGGIIIVYGIAMISNLFVL